MATISIPSTMTDIPANYYKDGSGNNNDFYYFTGISLSYIFYRIPCPKKSAPYNSIY